MARTFPFKVYYIDREGNKRFASEHSTLDNAEKAKRRILSMSGGKMSAERILIEEERPRKANPRGLSRINRLYESFRGRAPQRYGRISIPKPPRAVMVLGYLRGISYDTTVHGRAQGYDHRFAAGSRPLLCSDGKRLYILRGRFKVTGRGIVDLDRDGREEN